MTNYRNEAFEVVHVHDLRDGKEIGVSLRWKKREDVIKHVAFEPMDRLAGGVSIQSGSDELTRPFWKLIGVGDLSNHRKPTPPGYLSRVAASMAIDYISDTRDVTVVRSPKTNAARIEPEYVRMIRHADTDKKDHIFARNESTSLCGRAEAHGSVIPVYNMADVDDENVCHFCWNRFGERMADEDEGGVAKTA